MFSFYLMWTLSIIMIIAGSMIGVMNLVIVGMIGNMIFLAAKTILDKIEKQQ